MSRIESFEMEITTLKRSRKVWVYLPEGYSKKANKRYPVIYMHDGQNLFYDELTAYGAAWHVDKVLDDIYSATGNACIVVGVECLPERRFSEYSPWKMSAFPRHDKRHIPKDPINLGGEGAEYAEWFANTLKPIIDERYNTDPDRCATAVAGSSMGGLISCYIGLKYQNIYETMGLFSGYTDFNRGEYKRFLKNNPQTEKQHAFVYCGGKEWGDDERRNARMENQSIRLYETLAKRNVSCVLALDSELPHYETAWETYFRPFARDFLDRYYSSLQNC